MLPGRKRIHCKLVAFYAVLTKRISFKITSLFYGVHSVLKDKLMIGVFVCVALVALNAS